MAGICAGKTALVTGASGGLGDVIARRLAAEGAHVIVTGRRGDALERLARDIGATPVVCDLADRSDVSALVERAREVDVLVSNAALPATGAVADFTPEELDRALDVNLRAPIQLCRAAATAMTGRGVGQIVVISSMGAKVLSPQLAVYASTKAGLRAFALGLREDLCSDGVGVTVVLPGPIRDAGMWADANVPKQRGLRTRSPDAVAGAVVRAIRSNPAEIAVAPFAVRAAGVFCDLWPAGFARLGRRMGADRQAELLAEAQRHMR
jgi:short-subunit dehydrogenase